MAPSTAAGCANGSRWVSVGIGSHPNMRPRTAAQAQAPGRIRVGLLSRLAEAAGLNDGGVPYWGEATERLDMGDKEKASPDDAQKVRLTEPTSREGVDLSEHVRKGTDPFPVVNVAPEDVQPAVSPDPPPASDGPGEDG